jgi:uncharacterized membrane protein affecting hemolysin expression
MVWLVAVLLMVVVWTFVAREAALQRQIEMLAVQLATIEEQQIEAAERAVRDRESIWRLGLKVSALQHRSEALDANICEIEERISATPERRARARAVG